MKSKIFIFQIVFIITLINAPFKANAQCLAKFSYKVSLWNNGQVDFTDSTIAVDTNAFESWDFGDGYKDDSVKYGYGGNFHTYHNSGKYYVCLTVFDTLNSCTDTFCDSISVIFDSNPYYVILRYQPSTSMINAIEFNASASAAQAPVSFLWDFGDGISSNLTSPVHQYASSGTYYVCLQGIDSLGRLDTFCDSISTIGGNFCNAYFASGGTQETVFLTNYSTDSGPFYSTSWDWGDGVIDSTTIGGLVMHAYSKLGKYKVCLTISDPTISCSDTFCKYITVGNQGGCRALFKAVYDTLSATNGVSFINFSEGSVNTTNYYWDFGDGNSSTLENPHHNYASPGSYFVRLIINDTDSLNNCANTFCDSVLVGPCNAAFTMVVDSLDPTHYYIYVNNNHFSYLWNFGDGNYSNAKYPNYTYSGPGPYMFCLTTKEINGCEDTFCDSIYEGRSSGPMSFTVLGTVNVLENKKCISFLENYPNPFNTSTKIVYTIQENADVELNILNLLGAKVVSIESGNKPAGNYSLDWDAQDLPPGFYTLQLMANNNIATKKLIIVK